LKYFICILCARLQPEGLTLQMKAAMFIFY
jgi:hypothetical protein